MIRFLADADLRRRDTQEPTTCTWKPPPFVIYFNHLLEEGQNETTRPSWRRLFGFGRHPALGSRWPAAKSAGRTDVAGSVFRDSRPDLPTSQVEQCRRAHRTDRRFAS